MPAMMAMPPTPPTTPPTMAPMLLDEEELGAGVGVGVTDGTWGAAVGDDVVLRKDGCEEEEDDEDDEEIDSVLVLFPV